MLEETTYFHSDREQIKEGRCNPSDTRGYIEALEAIAKIAYKMWFYSGKNCGKEAQASAVNDAYDALAKVDWMYEDKGEIDGD